MTDVRPVGEALARELRDRGWTQQVFAEILGRPAQAISEIIGGKKRITWESAAQIGAALGTPADHWLALQDGYQLAVQARDSGVQVQLADVRLRARQAAEAELERRIASTELKAERRIAMIELEIERYFFHSDWCCAKGCPGWGFCGAGENCDLSCKCEQRQARLLVKAVTGYAAGGGA